MTVERDAQEAREPEVGPAAEGPPEFHPYHHPAAGWGAAKSVTEDRGRLTEPMAREPDTNNAAPTRPLDSLVLDGGVPRHVVLAFGNPPMPGF
ncbi:hypothetical protein [Streptomyces murinus]|uniref:hypothetical protein n=1 Tax=Streptomyces murinus TaxID=33900 RepID=UPI003F45A1D8